MCRELQPGELATQGRSHRMAYARTILVPAGSPGIYDCLSLCVRRASIKARTVGNWGVIKTTTDTRESEFSCTNPGSSMKLDQSREIFR